MNLFNLLNHQPIDFFYLAIDEFFEINLLQLSNFYSISPHKLNIHLKIKNSGHLLNHPETIKFINTIALKSKHKIAIIPFKPSAKILKTCHKNHWLYLANPPHLNRLLEDKIKFTQICTDNNFPIIKNIIRPFNQNNFAKAQEIFGKNIVCQTHFGWAGNSTHLLSDWNLAKNTIKPNTPTKFSPLLEGYTLLNNCCQTQSGLIQSPPALQFTGIKPLTTNPFTTVGRQWPAYISPQISQQIYNITINFSAYLKKINYLGFFGLDFFVNQDNVFLLECNPRLTASFSFYTQIEINNHLDPLFLFHLCQFLDLKHNPDLTSNQDRFFNTNLVGSELVLKNNTEVTIKRIQKFIAFSSDPNHLTIPALYLNELIS